MEKFRIVCDPDAKSNGSSRIIVDATNEAAKKIGLYDENGWQVNYDCLCQDHRLPTDVFWCAFELPFANFMLQHQKPILGLSKDNGLMAALGNYPLQWTNYVSLGVDTNKWGYCYKNGGTKGKFTFLCACESNTRSNFETLIPAFTTAFKGNNNVRLYIKDRNATDRFKEWIKGFVDIHGVDIVHDDRDLSTVEEQLEVFSQADVFICINHCHTFGMNRLQAMSCGIPVMTTMYQGGAEYMAGSLADNIIPHQIHTVTQPDIERLIKRNGLKNHLPTISPFMYGGQVVWSAVNEFELADRLIARYNKASTLLSQSVISRRVAEWFSWERTAINMSAALFELKSQGNLTK